ncbi:unnamed protein product [Larinioides sclopetarius]|uniref:Uncharacterized protein n=1 Tax=Larinioides sclopetarius TaxID=280406 RepID=A0AAV2AGE9_9ARAC
MYHTKSSIICTENIVNVACSSWPSLELTRQRSTRRVFTFRKSWTKSKLISLSIPLWEKSDDVLCNFIQ